MHVEDSPEARVRDGWLTPCILGEESVGWKEGLDVTEGIITGTDVMS